MTQHFVRALTQDERHAAEAAFRNQPVDPRWSTPAHHVYRELRAVLLHRQTVSMVETPGTTPSQAPDASAADLATTTPFHLRPVLVWRIIFQDTKEEQLRLFPNHLTVTAVVQMMKHDVPTRPFTMHMVQFGTFPLQRQGLAFYTCDARQIDQNGQVHLPIPSNPPASEAA